MVAFTIDIRVVNELWSEQKYRSNVEINRVRIEILNWLLYKSDCLKSKERERQAYIWERREHTRRSRVSHPEMPGLALLLGMGAGGGPWGPQATGLMPAALGQTPQKPPGQIPCQHLRGLQKRNLTTHYDVPRLWQSTGFKISPRLTILILFSL